MFVITSQLNQGSLSPFVLQDVWREESSFSLWGKPRSSPVLCQSSSPPPFHGMDFQLCLVCYWHTHTHAHLHYCRLTLMFFFSFNVFSYMLISSGLMKNTFMIVLQHHLSWNKSLLWYKQVKLFWPMQQEWRKINSTFTKSACRTKTADSLSAGHLELKT